MTMFRHHFSTLLIALTTVLSLGVATDAMAHDDGLMRALHAIDTVPTREALDEHLGDEAPEALMAVSADDTLDVWTRSRALTLLSHYPEHPEVRAFLESLTTSDVDDLRRRSLYTLGVVYGVPGDADLVGRVAAALDDPELRVRENAVRTLRWIDHPDAADALQRATENDELASLATLTIERREARMREAADDGRSVVNAPDGAPTQAP